MLWLYLQAFVLLLGYQTLIRKSQLFAKISVQLLVTLGQHQGPTTESRQLADVILVTC